MKNEYNAKKGISYPEQFMLAYLEVKGIEFEYQKQLNNSKRRFDFYLPKTKQAIEVHGLQHYEESNLFNHKETVKSDQEKRKYCKKHDITLIELDARKSEFNFIKKNIEKCELLPNIKKNEEEKIVKLISENNEYDVELMLALHNEGMNSLDIGIKMNIHNQTVLNILYKNGIEKEETSMTKNIRNAEEICQMYESGMSIVEINKKLGVDNSSFAVDKILKDNFVELRGNSRHS